MSEGDSYHFSWSCVVLYLFVAAVECNRHVSSTALVNTVVFDPIMDETTIIFAVIVTPVPNNNLAREMQDNAVIMIFRGVDTNQFEDIRDDFLTAIAVMVTSECASVVDCGTRNQVTYTSDHVNILPGYPRLEGSDLVVAFSVVLPDEAVPTTGDGLVLEQHVLLALATTAANTVTRETGLVVARVDVYKISSTSSDDDNDVNLALILPLTLIPAVIIIGLGALLGSLYIWKVKRLNFNDVATPEVEMIAYQNTDKE